MGDFRFCVRFKRWEDGELVEKALEKPDRWEVHSAERILVTLHDLEIAVVQQPNALNSSKIGVGACLWDGALLLAGYLATQPRYRFQGSSCIELGAGVGVVGIALAKMGANVILTDIKKVLPLLRENLEANGYDAAHLGSFQPGRTSCANALELEWGKEESMRWVDMLHLETPPDYVVAADCCYVDLEAGRSPSMPAFVEACARLAGPVTRVLVSFERRSSEVRRCFLEQAHLRFGRVEMVPLKHMPAPLRLEYCDLWELSNPLCKS